MRPWHERNLPAQILKILKTRYLRGLVAGREMIFAHEDSRTTLEKILDGLEKDLDVLVFHPRTPPIGLRGYRWQRRPTALDSIFGKKLWLWSPWQVGSDWRNPASPGEHQFPMPSVDMETGRLKDWGKTWVRVAHLAQLPWWLLLDQRKVYLERDDRTTRYFSLREIRQGKWYLSGREILQRVPLEKSFLMSVMGWPLAYIRNRLICAQGEAARICLGLTI